MRMECPNLGPMESHRIPNSIRAKTAPATDATPALPISGSVRFRSSRITGSRAAGANVAKKEAKNENQDA